MLKSKYNIEKIIKQLKKYEYVSFDIFDTLIKRNIQRPSDIFELVQLQYENKYNEKINNYKEIRINAEIKAKNLDINKEPNIDDIYKCLELNKKKYNIEELKKIEISLEYKLCQKNYDFYPIYKYCIDNNKKIIITSDMYLKKEQIMKILNNCNIKKYDYLFISNDVKLNKHNGKIYEYIINKLNINSNQIIHIGDSKRGDYIFPKVYGIKSILIPKKIENCRYNKYDKNNKDLEVNILHTYINNNLYDKDNEYEKIGYEILGPLLYGFTKWLIVQLNKLDIRNVFFLAREGNLLKKAFEIINSNDKFRTNYLYVSRRSTRCCNLTEINSLEELYKILKIKKIDTLNDLLLKTGLELKDYKNINGTATINKNKYVESIFNEIKDEIKVNAKKEEKNLLGYLNQEKFYGKLAIVDIGWAGTMQNNLCNIMKKNNIEYDIYGFYIGSYNNLQYNINMNSYIKEFDSIRAFVHLFEDFFLAQHGTTLKYEFEKNKYKPILDYYEYSDKEKFIFCEIQKGAIKFCENFSKLELDCFIKDNAKIIYEPLKKFGTQPSLKVIKLFNKFTYLDTSNNLLTTDKNMLYYIFKPKKFYEDFYKSGWKVGFLKKVFKIKLPYFKIYKEMLKLNR